MSIAASHRPDPDELAAFIDGQLSGEERQKLEIHLGACEACREIVAESVLLLEDVSEESLVVESIETGEAEDAEPEGGKILTHPGWRRTAWQMAPLAAAALLVLMLRPTLTSLLYGPVNSTGLIASYANPQGWIKQLGKNWAAQEWPVFRSNNYVRTLSDEQIAFRLGVRAVDLQVALRGGTPPERMEILNELIVLLRDGLESIAIELQYQQIRDSIDAVPDKQTLDLASQAEDDLELHLESDYFSLGRWAEAGRLATIIGDEGYFGRRWFSRQARKLERAELKPKVTKQIQHIRDVAESPVDERTLQQLRQAFAEISRGAG